MRNLGSFFASLAIFTSIFMLSLVAMPGCKLVDNIAGSDNSDDEKVAPSLFFQSKPLAVDSSGHFLSEIVYTSYDTDYWPPNFAYSFDTVYIKDTYTVNGTNEHTWMAFEETGEDWDQDSIAGEGWVVVDAHRGGYSYNAETHVMTWSCDAFFVVDPGNPDAPLSWLTPQYLAAFGTWWQRDEGSYYFGEKNCVPLYARTDKPNEFLRIINDFESNGRQLTRRYHIAINFSGASPSGKRTQERIMTLPDGITVDSMSPHTYKFIEEWSDVVGSSPTPAVTSLANDGNYSFLYTQRSRTYYDWDTSTENFSATPRSGYPLVEYEAGNMGFMIVDGDLLESYWHAQRSLLLNTADSSEFGSSETSLTQ